MKQFTLLFVLLSLGVIISISSDDGRNGEWANAPGDSGYCSACHTSSGAGSITLSGAPSSYQAGQTYNMTLTINQATAVVGGFQIVATNGMNNTNMGTFNPSFGQRINDVQRLVQSSPKAFGLGSVSWPISWTAPASGAPSNVKFYFAGNAANGDGSNGAGDIAFANSTALIPLPVELSSFTAQHHKQKGNVISWVTEAQINHDYFELQSSIDGRNFNTIYTEKGLENTTSKSEYSFIDPSTNALTFYRLRMVDLDGQANFSDVISVSTKENLHLQVFPNPVLLSQSFNILGDFSDSNLLSLHIYTMSGQQVVAQKYQAISNNLITLQPSEFDLKAGQYILQITDSQNITQSILLQIH